MRSRFGTALFVVILALVVPAPAMSGDDNTESETSTNESALTVHVTPAFAFAPARVRALVKIREDSRNRRLHVVIDSGGQVARPGWSSSKVLQLGSVRPGLRRRMKGGAS